MSRSFQELNSAVIQWAIDRDLITQTPAGQIIKSLEELHELIEADHDGDEAELVDAIGDVQVTILVYCAQRGYPPLETFKPHFDAEYFGDVWEPIRETGYEPGDADVLPSAGVRHWADLSDAHDRHTRDDVLPYVGEYYYWLLRYCAAHGYDPVSCLAAAYEEIRDRSGLIVGGRFQKEDDL